jgi:hypothetical protein
MMGPGKYDDLCTYVRTSTSSKGCIVIAIQGSQGSGMSCQATPEITNILPAILRRVADNIEEKGAANA